MLKIPIYVEAVEQQSRASFTIPTGIKHDSNIPVECIGFQIPPTDKVIGAECTIGIVA